MGSRCWRRSVAARRSSNGQAVAEEAFRFVLAAQRGLKSPSRFVRDRQVAGGKHGVGGVRWRPGALRMARPSRKKRSASPWLPTATIKSPSRLVGDRQVVLWKPVLAASVAARRSRTPGRRAEGPFRFGPVAHRHHQVAQLCCRRPTGRAGSRCWPGVGGGQALSNGQAVAEEAFRFGPVAHRHHQVAQPFVGDRQVALEAGVGGVGGGQALSNGQAVAEEALRFGPAAPPPLIKSPSRS